VPAALPSRARVVIVGGGIAGTSVAFHLAALGWTDVLLLEQNRLAGGTTWHAAGMVTRLRTSSSMMRINQASADLYARLPALSGHDPGWRPVGSLVLAQSADRLRQYHRTTAMARRLGVECHEISPSDCATRFPGLHTQDLVGAYWIPGDGRCLPAEIPVALARAASNAGVRILENTRVTALRTRHGRVTGVTVAPDLPLEAEVVVLCGGMWSRQLAATAGVAIPLHAVEHHYVVSNPVPDASGNLPCTRDMDAGLYFRGEDVPHGGAILAGAFQQTTKPWDVPRIPDDFSFRLLPPDWPKFEAPLAAAIHRLPALAAAGFDRFVNGPESFTPDNQWLMGETAELRGLFVLAGFNSAGIASAGGAGQALAEWIVGGEMPFDLTSVDIRRFGPRDNDTAFLRERVTEALGLHYQMAWPNREFTTGRNRRTSPLHATLAQAGACFGSKGGWERPLWFARPDPGCATTPEMAYAFGRQNWFLNHAAEHRACRDSVAVFDQSSFAKLLVRGPDALRALQWLATANLDVAPGRLVYTGLLTPRGGYASDLTIARLTENSFLAITGSAQGPRDLAWIRHHAPPDASNFEIIDASESHAVIGVMGPRSRELLQSLTPNPAALDPAAFPYLTHQPLPIAGTDVRALRVTYVGELGWELHVPAPNAESILSLILARGRDLRIPVSHAGHYAIQSLRLEKGYRAYGAELSPDESPLEAGLTFTVAWNKPGGFLGLEALAQRRSQGPSKRLALLALDDPLPILWGAEPVLRNGTPVGHTTSAAYGHTVGASVALAYLRNPDGRPFTDDEILRGSYTIELDGAQIPARASLRPWYDPDRRRILS